MSQRLCTTPLTSPRPLAPQRSALRPNSTKRRQFTALNPPAHVSVQLTNVAASVCMHLILSRTIYVIIASMGHQKNLYSRSGISGDLRSSVALASENGSVFAGSDELEPVGESIRLNDASPSGHSGEDPLWFEF